MYAQRSLAEEAFLTPIAVAYGTSLHVYAFIKIQSQYPFPASADSGLVDIILHISLCVPM